MKKTIIEDITDKRVSIFTEYNEAQLYHYFEPNGGVFIAETPNVISRALARGCEPMAFLVEEKAYESQVVTELLKEAEDAYVDFDSELEVFVARLEVINKITGFNLTRGVLAVFKRPTLQQVRDLLMSSNKVAILEDVMNPTNVGAIFRSAAALGVDAIFLTHDSADPFYRRAARVAMGTSFQVPWTYFDKGSDYVSQLHSEGYKVVSMALKENAIPLSAPELKEHTKLAIIFGTESTGIKDETIAKSDYVTIIPMHHDVDSLNVAAASAVTFWELCGRG
ncbi:tRNA G18 (ribose-2'-O)-methylase SpoU [Pseudobutyrivibrio sp. YE44]|uniref:TrmH family RNA methyltransferase n=1 Tax=Pseudobutyrivibrio sp. YE44 TaxID=1520802 RepID=UPI0008916B90|nr:RNA methyltransferase [Pseudobutyrivibrio sp. YE44]SDB34137.1 tRNA G18 (ribose-2'-O)-methylase SpoU [Pseudobutyrivibrio sp. YE44]